MKLHITARHFKLTDALRTFAETEVARLEKYHDGIIDCEVILAAEKQTQIAEILLKVYGQKLTATEKSENIQKSVTLAVDKLERQLKKYKGKFFQKKGNVKAGLAFMESKVAQAV